MTNSADWSRRYQDLQRYVGWTDDDARNLLAVAALLDPHLDPLVDDFYAEIERHPDARKVITGGAEQIARLKGSLVRWVRELLSGPYDAGYIERRLRVGGRHVEIGLDQVYTNVALSRLRDGLIAALGEVWPGDRAGLVATIRSLNKLLDLDLAGIEDAYQAEYLARQQRAERFATIGQVGSGVAHELRNPLNVIKTSVYYLLNARNPTPEKTTEHLRRVEQQVTIADRVITTLSQLHPDALSGPEADRCPAVCRLGLFPMCNCGFSLIDPQQSRGAIVVSDNSGLPVSTRPAGKTSGVVDPAPVRGVTPVTGDHQTGLRGYGEVVLNHC